MKIRSLYLLTALLLFGCQKENTTSGKINPVILTTEYLENPAVVDVSQPRLSWINEAEPGERGQEQTAWQVRVASTQNLLSEPDLWDSKKVESNQSTLVKYQGKPLTSRQECWWQIRTWDKDGNPSAWSKPAFWRMGLLEQKDWEAEWIGAPWQSEEALPKPTGGPNADLQNFPPPAPLLRKTFQLEKKVAKAVVFITGLGYFELYVNGEKIGDDVLVPNQTNYGKRPEIEKALIALPDEFKKYKVMYLAYDVKDQLQKGDNVIGGILGNGFYNPSKFWAGGYGSPRLLAQLHVTYNDGSEEIIKSDQSWKASKSAILMDMVYYGEHYDARLEQPGWSSPGFDDSKWEPVASREAPHGQLVAHTAAPDKVLEKFEPVKITKTDSGTHRVEFGVEISGWLRLQNVEAPAGHKIKINYLSNLFSGDNTYIFKGEGKETYAARFNWFVFSGVEIENWPGDLSADQLVAEAVNTDVPVSAEFETANPLFNNINKIWKRSQIGNMHGGIASDCPHRERSGYTGDGQVACVTVLHNFDSRAFYNKWIHDMIDAQIEETGYVPNGAPWQPGCGGGVAWGAAISIMPWEFYLHHGDIDLLEDAYDGMKGYIRYMKTWVDDDGIMFSQATGKDGKVLKWLNLGEWCAPSEDHASQPMVHTFYFWYSAQITAKTARALGKIDEAEKYKQLADATKKAFQKRFYNKVSNTYGNGGGNVLALTMGVPESQKSKVVAALKANILANKKHLDTGIFGTRFLFEVLADNGLQSLAYEILNQRTFPSFGYWLAQGATTTREKWDNGGSHNHPMFGGGLVWFYQNLAGMRRDENQPAYRHIIFKPQPVATLGYAKYYNQTDFGRAGVHWQKDSSDFDMKISVPVGSYATVYIPAKENQNIIENGQEPKQENYVNYKGRDGEYEIFEVGSGDYLFEVTEASDNN